MIRIFIMQWTLLTSLLAEVGIEGGCSAVCQLLPSPLEQAICSILCDLKGIQYFIDLVNEYVLSCELPRPRIRRSLPRLGLSVSVY